MNLHEQPRRGRPPKAAQSVTNEDRRERRRPVEGDPEEAGLKLAIPTWVKEKYPEAEFEYRWFAGKPARMLQANRNDWDVVEGVDQVPATDKDGHEANHVLHVKYRAWYEADRAPREDRRREIEKQMLRGKVQAQGDDASEDTLSDKFQYEEAVAQNRLS